MSEIGGVLNPPGHVPVPPGKHDCVVLPMFRSGKICRKRARLKKAGSRRAPAKTNRLPLGTSNDLLKMAGSALGAAA